MLTARHLLESDAESRRALFYLFLLVGKKFFQPQGCTMVMFLLCATPWLAWTRRGTRAWVVRGGEHPGLP